MQLPAWTGQAGSGFDRIHFPILRPIPRIHKSIAFTFTWRTSQSASGQPITHVRTSKSVLYGERSRGTSITLERSSCVSRRPQSRAHVLQRIFSSYPVQTMRTTPSKHRSERTTPLWRQARVYSCVRHGNDRYIKVKKRSWPASCPPPPLLQLDLDHVVSCRCLAPLLTYFPCSSLGRYWT